LFTSVSVRHIKFTASPSICALKETNSTGNAVSLTVGDGEGALPNSDQPLVGGVELPPSTLAFAV
jgi:hypothetical protein